MDYHSASAAACANVVCPPPSFPTGALPARLPRCPVTPASLAPRPSSFSSAFSNEMLCVRASSSIPTTENSIDFYSLSSGAPGALWQRAHKRVRYGRRGRSGEREAGETSGGNRSRPVCWLAPHDAGPPRRRHVIHFTQAAAR